MSVKLEVTQEAKHQVQELIRSQKSGTAVRVFVQPGGGGGGGCGSGGCGCGEGAASGPSFGLAFDRPRNGDEVVQVDGFSIVVDPMSAADLDGAKIDYVQGLDASGFTIVSPNRPMNAPPVGSGCGCGSGGCGSGGGGGCC